MSLNIPEQRFNDAVIAAHDTRVTLSGFIDQHNSPVFLQPFFQKVNEQMGSRVELDIRDLTFLNSSGIKCLVEFILRRKAGSSVLIFTDEQKIWQHNALSVIRLIDQDNITLVNR